MLAAFRCVDAISGGTVSSGLTVMGRFRMWQNRSSTYVIYKSLRGDSRGGAIRTLRLVPLPVLNFHRGRERAISATGGNLLAANARGEIV